MHKKWIGAIALTLVFVTLAPSPARAASTNPSDLSRRMFLATPAGQFGGHATIVGSARRIYLDAGYYKLTNSFYMQKPRLIKNERSIYLAAGYYKWNCWIEPKAGEFDPYTSNCYVQREATGAYAFLPDLTVLVLKMGTWNGMPGEWVDWVALLDPL